MSDAALVTVFRCESCDLVVGIPVRELAPGAIELPSPHCARCPGHPELALVVKDVVLGDPQR